MAKKKKESKITKERKVTPLMKQYNAIKARYPDALLLFRVGDFYETFGVDAIVASQILGIVLTKRSNGAASEMELAGFPHHALDTYLPRLVRAGKKVAICDQLEDPKMTKKIVKRGVTELVTPGVSYNDKILDQKENNFLAGIHFAGKSIGIAFLDISTGEFYVAEGNRDYIDKLLQSFRPSEVVLQRSNLLEFNETFGGKFFTSTFEDWVFTEEFGYEILQRHFGTTSLKGFGVEVIKNGVIASGAVMHYLKETHHNKTDHLCKISRIEEDSYVWLDRFTIRNLELLQSFNDDGASLLKVIDATTSPMGARMLRRWIVLPLKDRQPIEERHNVVSFLINNPSMRDELIKNLKLVGDLERLISKVAVGKVNPRELQHIKKALFSIEIIKKYCSDNELPALNSFADQLSVCLSIRNRINEQLMPDPSINVAKGGVIANGVSAELDELRELSGSGKQFLVQIQQREIVATGISSLKIGFNNVFGYYLEVTNTHKDKVPDTWIRKQTLVNAERYITEELKLYEQKILGAEEKILAIESELYKNLVLSLTDFIKPIQTNAVALARLDVLVSFSLVSEQNNYVRPEMNDSFDIDIVEGRHPVIEQQLQVGDKYITNNVFLDNKKQQIMMITGPNMSGKSALLRQTALIVLLAQMGCFVPAESANIGIVDKVFTRVGASDNISSGESTFMVEMNETASILNNVSSRSLILLDEIGRGTSTYDGVSIAWSIAEYLHNHPTSRPKVLFATHYHELNQMEKLMKRIKNFHVTVREVGNKVIFLRKLARGGTEHSFGIHVARMAGMPQVVVKRAEDLLKDLEATHNKSNVGNATRGKPSTTDDFQLSFIQLDDPLLMQIKEDILNTDINVLTPVEALMKLNEIKKMLNK